MRAVARLVTVAAVLYFAFIAVIHLLAGWPAADAGSASRIVNYSTTAICTDPAKRDSDCGMVRKYKSGWVRDEARDLQTYTDATYLGWASKDLSNLDRGYFTRGSVNTAGEGRWHLYRINE